MRILITGGAGFIGSHIAEHFNGKAEIRVLDNLRSGYLHNLAGDCKWNSVKKYAGFRVF